MTDISKGSQAFRGAGESDVPHLSMAYKPGIVDPTLTPLVIIEMTNGLLIPYGDSVISEGIRNMESHDSYRVLEELGSIVEDEVDTCQLLK